MKTLLAILLLIPSLSWGEVIWLSCQEYENTTYKDGEVFTKAISDNSTLKQTIAVSQK